MKATKRQLEILGQLVGGPASAYTMRSTPTALWNMERKNLVRPIGGLGSMAFPQSMLWTITDAGRTALAESDKKLRESALSFGYVEVEE